MCSSMYRLEFTTTSVCGLGLPPSSPLLPAGRAPSFSPILNLVGPVQPNPGEAPTTGVDGAGAEGGKGGIVIK